MSITFCCYFEPVLRIRIKIQRFIVEALGRLLRGLKYIYSEILTLDVQNKKSK
jgi:hypothetical protein